jgi:Na+-driven multidrug efflux pump
MVMGLKLGVQGAAISVILSQAFPAILMLALYYFGKFTVKPKLRDLFRWPLRETPHSLAIGLPSLLSSLAGTIPVILFQKYLGESTSDKHEYDEMIKLYNAFSRLYNVAMSLYLAICMGLLPAGSYAFSSRDYSRTGRLIFHAWWILGVLGLCATFFMNVLSDFIARLFSRDGLFVTRFRECVIRYWSTTTFIAWEMLGTCILQVVNRPVPALICTVIGQICFFPMVSSIFFFTNRHDPVRLFFAAMANDPSACTITWMFVIPGLWNLRKRFREKRGVIGALIVQEEGEESQKYG